MIMDFLFGHCEAIWPWPKHLKHLITLDLYVEGLEHTFSFEFTIGLGFGESSFHALSFHEDEDG